MILKRSSVSRRERALVGSSMMTREASSERARAMPTRWRSATESSRTRLSTDTGSSTRSRSSRALARMARQSRRPERPLRRWPEKMFSATVRSGNIEASWWMTAIPASWASTGPRNRRSLPSKPIVPELGV